METTAETRPAPFAATDRVAIERQVRRFFADDPRGAAAVYLFGSVARGTARRDSDVDVAVLLEEDPPRTLAGLRFDLQGELEELLGLPVELVVLNHRSADFIHHVLSDGLLVLDHDPESRIAFEVRARNEYFDLLPFLRRYRRMEPAR
jgi:predicted nucleotidyltransferase